MVPKPEHNKNGVTPGFQNADEVDFTQVYVAKETDDASVINAKLDELNHVVF